MRIGIHASHLNEPHTDGIKVFLKNLILNIKNLDQKDQFFLYYKEIPKGGFVEAPNFKHIIVKGKGPWTQIWLPAQLFKDKIDALYVPLQTLPFCRPKMRTITTIQDLAFFDVPGYFKTSTRTLLYLFSSYAIRNADKIITPSESTKNDIINHYKIKEEKVIVAPLAYNKDLFKKAPPTFDREEVNLVKCRKAAISPLAKLFNGVKKKYKISKPFILYVGVMQPRKNVKNLIKAFNILKKKYKIPHQLVLASSLGWLYEETLAEIEKSVFKKDIIRLGDIKYEELPKFYWMADVFVLPSLYEGFGLPLLEALASGTPVVTANNSSLPEVGGDAAIYIENPKNPIEIAEKIFNVISNEGLKEEMRQKGFKQAEKFSWEKCTKQILEVIKS